MKEWIKKHKMSLFVTITAAVMLIGLSYAWLQITLRGEKEINIFAAGSLQLVLDDNMTGGINLNNAVPVTEEEGKSTDGYTFTLENTGKVDSDYTIYLDDLDIDTNLTRMQDNFIKYYLVKDGKEIGINLLSSTGVNPERVLDSGTIEAGEKYSYTLKMWIDEAATNEVMNTAFKGQLRIEAMQTMGHINKPKLDSNMIAVVYDEAKSSWIKIDNDDSNWYNYDTGKWANAVTVNASSKNNYLNASNGTSISMDDIETMWVWIPRYSYTIGSEDGENYYGKQGTYLNTTPTQELPGEIDVKFISRATKERGQAKYKVSEGISGWRTPDAFTFGNEELSGIWVGKFETSSSNPTASNGGDNVTTLDAMIKPNVTSWRSIQVANIGEVGRKVTGSGNRYGFSTKLDSHAMKNDEWASVAYLSQSKYGKLGNSGFTGVNKEIYQNKSDQYITGCSYGSPSNANTDYGCQYTYNITGSGTGASTTGTIYGVYDMSGGAWEYVMGNYNKYSGYSSKSYTVEEAAALGREDGQAVGIWNSGYTGQCGFDNLTFEGKNWLEDKYYNIYTSTNPLTACNGYQCISHGLSEVVGWYGDYTIMIEVAYPWFIRGGRWYNTSGAGVFSFYDANGAYNNSDRSFRLVLS